MSELICRLISRLAIYYNFTVNATLHYFCSDDNVSPLRRRHSVPDYDIRCRLSTRVVARSGASLYVGSADARGEFDMPILTLY